LAVAEAGFMGSDPNIGLCAIPRGNAMKKLSSVAEFLPKPRGCQYAFNSPAPSGVIPKAYVFTRERQPALSALATTTSPTRFSSNPCPKTAENPHKNTSLQAFCVFFFVQKNVRIASYWVGQNASQACFPPRGFSLKTPENKAVPKPLIQGV
jgi:hypothetical protein